MGTLASTSSVSSVVRPCLAEGPLTPSLEEALLSALEGGSILCVRMKSAFIVVLIPRIASR